LWKINYKGKGKVVPVLTCHKGV